MRSQSLNKGHVHQNQIYVVLLSFAERAKPFQFGGEEEEKASVVYMLSAASLSLSVVRPTVWVAMQRTRRRHLASTEKGERPGRCTGQTR
ncbi:hypothetical protein PoB_005495500 [Plakobranchus ocellatus]|uniref:Uncharacterized protein n=1 Tax=Plakobranchus ocellatus TaxID=259542 RepID=A0AAV4C6W9_9GAST|nr:hypothetical protein PoB_005495500 [Plakobranchus ocellatus]